MSHPFNFIANANKCIVVYVGAHVLPPADGSHKSSEI